MRLRVGLLVGLGIILFGTSALARARGYSGHHAGRSPSVGPSPGPSTPGHAHPHGRAYAHSPYFGSGLRSHGHGPYARYSYSPNIPSRYGWPWADFGYYGYPYSYRPQGRFSDYFPYLHFFDLYYRESLRTKEEADRYEESFRRENPGVTKAGGAPLSPRDVVVTVDGQQLAVSPSGGPLALGSGRHTLRISAKPAAPAASVP